MESQCKTYSLTKLELGVPKMADSQLHSDHHEQQGEYYGNCQANVQVQQNGGHKGHQPD